MSPRLNDPLRAATPRRPETHDAIRPKEATEGQRDGLPRGQGAQATRDTPRPSPEASKEAKRPPPQETLPFCRKAAHQSTFSVT